MKLYYFIGRLLHPFAAIGFYLFSLITKTPRVRIAVWNENEELLFVETWLSGGKWGMPGGGVKRGEPFEEAARRELHEETGIVVSADELQQLTTIHIRAHQEIVFALRVQRSSLPATLPDKFEVKAAGWYLPAHPPKLDPVALEVVRLVA